MSKIVNRSELAEIFGKSLPTVSAWITRGCPVVERGGRGREWQFDTAAVHDWLMTNAVAAASGDTSKMDIDEARRRKLAAEATMAEIDVDQRLARLVTVEDSRRVIGAQCAMVRTRLLAMPSTWAPRLHRIKTIAEIAEVMTAAVVEALEELSADTREQVQQLADMAAQEMN
jgi:phage terminase Nu1 subunit (DNA packaging protein)